MTKLGRLLTQAFFLGSWLSGDVVVTSQRLENAESGGTRLKTYWDDFGNAPLGCNGHAEITYKWRANDWEDNLIDLLLAWSHGVLGGHLDIAVILEPGSCTPESGCDEEEGVGTTAESTWSPFFLPMPHLCVFDTQQDWEDFMAASGASQEVQQAALSNLDKDLDLGEDQSATNPFQSGGTDLVESMTLGLDTLLSYMQPRILEEVQSILDVPDRESFKSVQYVGMHVRDIPPRMFGTFKATETLDCYETVFKYFEEKAEGVRPSDITGIWLASEDDTALPEAKALIGRYFRNAKADNIFQIGGPALPGDDADPSRAIKAASEAEGSVENNEVVNLLLKLDVLSSSSVFVGAFSTNLSRLIFFRREVLHHPTGTSVSADRLSPFPK